MGNRTENRIETGELKISTESRVEELDRSIGDYIGCTCKCLDICFPPPLYFSLHVACALSIIMANHENEDWFYNHFIQVSFYHDYADGNVHKYSIYPAMETRTGKSAASKFLSEVYVDQNVVDLKEDSLINNIKIFIDNNYYVTCRVDVSQLNGTRYAGRRLCLHGIMIFGYDDMKKTLDILDFDDRQAINLIKISWEDFVAAFTSPDIPKSLGEKINNTIVLRKKKKAAYIFDLEILKIGLRDYLDSYDSSRRYSMILPSDEKNTWGISTYGKIIEYLEENNQTLDLRLFQAFYEHKKVMFERFEYLERKEIFYIGEEILKALKDNMQEASTVKMMSLKYNMTGNLKIVERIIEKLKAIENKEKYLYVKILDLMG